MGAGRMALLAALAAAAVPLAGAGGCGRGPQTRTIAVDTLAFGAGPPGLKVGDTVVWDNASALEHSATAGDGSFDLDLPPGGAGRLTLRKAGTIPYFCRFHPGMRGELKVSA